MIEYVEIRNAELETVGIIDTAKSIIWNAEYYAIGNFEIYVQANEATISMLQIGNYVTRTNNRNVGIIEKIEITFSPEEGQMIVASGGFAKTLLSRRLIYSISGNSINPVVSRGLVEVCARNLVNDNIISASDAARNIEILQLGALAGITKRIVDKDGYATQKQTSYSNLQTYSDAILQEYKCGAYIGINREAGKLEYIVFEGSDRSTGNAGGNIPIVFSQEFDNLVSSAYSYDTKSEKNTALIGGEGEGTNRFMVLLSGVESGINRRELFVNASDQSKTYMDNETEQTYSDAEYTAMLKSKAAQELSKLVTVESFSGEIDITHSGLMLGEDVELGDVVTIQDNLINKYLSARIVTATEVQDDNGYSINIKYEV